MNICKDNIFSMNAADMAVYVVKQNEAAYRANQLFAWVHGKRVESFEEMLNIPQPLRESLSEDFSISLPQVEQKQQSADGTVKYLFRLEDGSFIESVLMRYKHGNTLCVSSQVGCNMGCSFCASTGAGKQRNLEAGEILGQVYAAAKDIDERIGNVVLMGVGEPLDNFENVLKFIELITDTEGYRMSERHISLSTCGLVPKIDELAQKELAITLSVSLHSAVDEKRSQIMPINKKYPLNELMRACREYFDKTGRRVSFEYAMLADFNDSFEDAQALVGLIKGMGAHVNLIPVNTVEGSDYTSSSEEKIAAFQKLLVGMGLNATVRRRLGTDIDAACGQLRANRQKH